ncbi:MAG: protein phosphatase CheZ [Burkholderiaceae bacterium]
MDVNLSVADRTAAATAPVVQAAPARGAGEQPDVYQRLGTLTRTLHDALRELGYDRDLESAMNSLPDARTRLSYIQRLTGEAAEKVLNSVDRARAEQDDLAERARRAIDDLKRDPVKAVSSGQLLNVLQDAAKASERTNGLLTEIMMAQDFHDLTGQVIGKVVELAQGLEAQLLKLLVEASPEPQRSMIESGWLNGPAMNAEQRSDVVTDQGQVDDLLESLGF